MITKEELKSRLLDTKCFIDNEWLDGYINILYDNKLDKHIKRYSQSHHALPKSYAKKLGIDIDNSDNNLFELPYKFHILAHVYLISCTLDKDLAVKNNYALSRMLSNKNIDNYNIDEDFLNLLDNLQREYELDISTTGDNSPVKGRKHTLEEREKMSAKVRAYITSHPGHNAGDKNGMFGLKGELNPNYGKKMSEEARKKMSDSWDYNKHVTDKSREKWRKNELNNIKNHTGWHSLESIEKAVKTRKENWTGYSDETIEKMRKNSHRKPVVCLETGKIYESTMAAERDTKHYHSHISGACNGRIEYTIMNRTNKTKLHWRYATQEEIECLKN